MVELKPTSLPGDLRSFKDAAQTTFIIIAVVERKSEWHYLCLFDGWFQTLKLMPGGKTTTAPSLFETEFTL